MLKKENKIYDEVKDWDFSHIKMTKENLTNWDMYEVLKNYAKKDSVALDLGTGGGEKAIENYPIIEQVIATDYSESMIKTAKENLIKSGRKDIIFKVMNNLEMDVAKNYFDIVTARHTIIDAKQIYECLKPNGILILRGVDKLDCWSLKRMFKRGQGYKDIKPISQIDYENLLDVGFKEVELIPLHVREYYATANDLYALLNKTPILDDFSEENFDFEKEKVEIDENTFNQYVIENTTEKGILLIRRYYGIVAKK